MEITPEVKKLAKKIWDYHQIHQKLEKGDCILALGSHDPRTAKRAAQLYLDGWAPLIVFSGGLGRLTKGIWKETEAEKFAKIAIKMGVSRKDIILEKQSTNTGENIQFSYKLLKSKGINPKKIILVHKPYMERRTYATFLKQWPEKKTKFIVTSPQIPFTKYPTRQIPIDEVINIMVSDLQRLKIYPQKGFQIAQKIPDNVWQAYQKLVKLGYTKYLIKDGSNS